MEVVTTRWSRAQVAATASDADEVPVLAPDEARPAVGGTWLWDLWPLRELADGSVTRVAGGELWMALSAPAEGHPGGRHDRARLALLHRDGQQWRSLGPVFPDGASPGSREWAGSAWHDHGTVHIDHTAAGERGESRATYRQRIMTATARLELGDGTPRLVHHSGHRELVAADGRHYQPATETEGQAGFIKAFRDPFRFRDPGGHDLLLFTASVAGATTGFDGAVGCAVLGDGGARLLPPLLTADGVNNELERPHLVLHEDRYLLFVSTQARTFHPDAPGGRSGLHGWVADRVGGPYRPLNGSGLVVATPAAEPFQTYSWLVLPDLSVSSFVDSHSLRGRQPAEVDEDGDAAAAAHFGGAPAPTFRLWVDGDRAGLATG